MGYFLYCIVLVLFLGDRMAWDHRFTSGQAAYKGESQERHHSMSLAQFCSERFSIIFTVSLASFQTRDSLHVAAL